MTTPELPQRIERTLWPNFKQDFTKLCQTDLSVLKKKMTRRFHANRESLLPESSLKSVSMIQQRQKVSYHSVPWVLMVETVVFQQNAFLRPL